MNRMIQGLLLSALAAFASAAPAAQVSEATVTKLMAEIDRAVPARDVPAIERLLAEDIAIVLTVNIEGNVQRIEMTKPEYLTMLHEAWAAASAYTYKRTNQKISIDGRKAVVTADVTESITAGSRTVVTKSQEMAVIEDVGGRLQATLIGVISLAEPVETGTLL